MATLDKLKDELLKRLLRLRPRERQETVGMPETGEFNLVLVIANDQLGCDILDLSISERERDIIPRNLRHADDHREITVAEMNLTLMSAVAFKQKLEAAIARLAAYVPPKDSIGFVRK